MGKGVAPEPVYVAQGYSSDLTDEQWARIAPLLPRKRPVVATCRIHPPCDDQRDSGHTPILVVQTAQDGRRDDLPMHTGPLPRHGSPR